MESYHIFHRLSQPYSNNPSRGEDQIPRGCIRRIIAFHCTGIDQSCSRRFKSWCKRRIESVDWGPWETRSLNRIEEGGGNNDSKGLLKVFHELFLLKGISVITAEDVLRSQGNYARDVKADESVSIVSRMNPVRKYVSGLRKSEFHRLQREMLDSGVNLISSRMFETCVYTIR